LNAAAPTLASYRTYVKTQAAGAWRWAIWMSNATDSTFGPGAPRPNQPGGSWRIESAYLADGGTAHDGSIVAGTQAALTFAGQPAKAVEPGERFWSDPVNLDLPGRAAALRL
jgi:hypothetical protein